MALFSLGLHRSLYPWVQAGITHLLCDQETVTAVRERAVAKPLAATVTERTARQSPSTTSTVRPPVPSPSLRQTTSSDPHDTTTTHVQTKSLATVPPPIADAVPDALPKAQWPAVWLRCLDKVPTQPLLLWSYHGLECDLGGQANAERRIYLRRLLTDLGLPSRSHAFWPLVPPIDIVSSASEVPQASFFWSGVTHLKPQTVIFLCDTIPDTLRLPTLLPNTPLLLHGRRYMKFCDIALLLEDIQKPTAVRHHQLVRFLQTVYQSYRK